MPTLASRPKPVVLVVEDEAILRTLAAEMVAEAGYAVLEAQNADEAVRILESNAKVRIVFTDIDMPGTMDGLKLAAAVRGRWPPIEIILTSGHHRVDESQLPERCVFVPKPYELNRLAAALRTFAE
jgi:CheY-like chemotaxis protein